MKKMKSFALSFIFLMSFIGCSEKEGNSTLELRKGSIYGRITDYMTGELISDANVSLLPGSETTLTGYDGEYEFSDIEDGNYHITVSKAEYEDLVDDFIIKVKDGGRMRRDVQIKKQQVKLAITDMNGNAISDIDFGSDPSSVVRSFNIFNNGTVSIRCSIDYSCVWIKSVSSIPSTISPGQTITVTVEIDRTKLVAGVNTTSLYIKSNNGNNVLTIRATGQENPPVVITLPVTQPDGTDGPYRNMFHGNITNVGYPPYTKRGFCWSSTNTVPTMSDSNIEIPGSGLGEYTYTWWGCWDENPGRPVTYYVRTWVKYGTNNTIIYGNVQPFIFNDF